MQNFLWSMFTLQDKLRHVLKLPIWLEVNLQVSKIHIPLFFTQWQCFGSGVSNRVGRVTGNKHIFLALQVMHIDSLKLLAFIYALLILLIWFSYARLQTGRIMVWWCPSVRLSGSPSARFPHFSHTCFDIYIELKFCTWLCFNVNSYVQKI